MSRTISRHMAADVAAEGSVKTLRQLFDEATAIRAIALDALTERATQGDAKAAVTLADIAQTERGEMWEEE